MQAILAAEPVFTGRPCLKATLQTLLKISRTCRTPVQLPTQYVACVSKGYTLKTTVSTVTKCFFSSCVSASSRSSVSPVQPQPAAVHALNILRALYRDSRLGDYVVPFVSEGVVIAIQGFSATSWPVGCMSMYDIVCTAKNGLL